MSPTSSTRSGLSLAKGPIAIVGLLAVAYGVLALIFGGNAFTLHVPHGRVGDGHFIGLLTNGWTDLLFIAAGVFLVLGAPAHWVAKFNAVIVAGVFGAAAIIAAIRGNGVFGIFAANGRTEIVWGAVAIALFLFALLPRVRRGAPAAVGQPRTTAAAGDGSDPRVLPDERPTEPARGPGVTR